MLKRMTPEAMDEFSIWNWRPIAADTFLRVMRAHSQNGGEAPVIHKRDITSGNGSGEYAHWYQFKERMDDLIIIFARDGRTTAFKRQVDPPEPKD